MNKKSIIVGLKDEVNSLESKIDLEFIKKTRKVHKSCIEHFKSYPKKTKKNTATESTSVTLRIFKQNTSRYYLKKLEFNH